MEDIKALTMEQEAIHMKQLFPEFLLGAATAAHQVEGNNIHSDFWAMEQMKYSSFNEPSLDAVDHYNRYREDIDLLAEAGLNAYRFSIEWARIEPKQGVYDLKEVEHYKDVITYCKSKGVEPIVTMHHFSSPKWLIEEGGWENEKTIEAFAKYCTCVIQEIGDMLTYICTINEANMGLELAAIMRSYMKQVHQDAKNANSDIQVGVKLEMPDDMQEKMAELSQVFGGIDPTKVHTFLSMRTEAGDRLIMRAHETARNAMKRLYPHLKIGVTLSLHDLQVQPGGEVNAAKEWEEEFRHYLPYIKNDDFFGLQNYTRKLVGPEGALPVPEGMEKTQMGYEFYPQALANLIRRVNKELDIPIIITENGVAVDDDKRRETFIKEALTGVMDCIAEGIPVCGYMYWSLLDNFEWQMGYKKTFGLIEVDRKTQKRVPKNSLKFLGDFKLNR